MNTESYTCRRMPDGCDHQDLQRIGDFSWRVHALGELAGQVSGMVILMPGGSGSPVANWVAVARQGETADRCTWQWDGNLDTPTLQPSLLLHNAWHGFMRDGRLESC